MRFLAPLFLLGALAVALPIVFHLVRHTTRERTVFSSLMFLHPAPPRLTRRNRLEHLLLLLLRCLALAVLAVGFARPFFRSASPPTLAAASPARRVVLLVDTSASMRRSGLWDETLRRLDASLRSLRPVDQASLLTFDQTTTILLSFDEWNASDPAARAALARERLLRHQPGWAGTHLDTALIRAAELAAETETPSAGLQRQVILLSDLQNGSRLNALASREWPAGVQLLADPIPAKPSGNAGIQLLPDTESPQGAPNPTLRLRVSNAADATREQFSVCWGSASGRPASEPVAVHVPAGQSRVVSLATPSPENHIDRILLQGDEQPFDNTVFLPPSEPTRVSVLYLGPDTESDPREPLFFLRRALQDTRRQVVQVLARRPGEPLMPSDWSGVALVVLNGSLPGEQVPRLRGLVRHGATALFLLGDPATIPALAGLLETPTFETTESANGSYRLIAELDFQHPSFAPFADNRYSDFSRIHFWRHRRLDPALLPGARVLARLDNDDPWLLECLLGRGRVLVATSGWQPAESQLALSSKFVPLLYSFLELSRLGTTPPSQFSVGNPVPIPVEWLDGEPVTVESPSGSLETLPAGSTTFTRTLQPGLYQIRHALGHLTFSVNLDPAETRTAPLPPDTLEQLGATARATPAQAATATPARLRDAELESRQKLWRWCLLASIAFLILEAWLSGRALRRNTFAAQPAPSPARS